MGGEDHLVDETEGSFGAADILGRHHSRRRVSLNPDPKDLANVRNELEGHVDAHDGEERVRCSTTASWKG